MRHDERIRHSRGLGLLIIFASLCAAFAVAYGITAIIYNYTGYPPEIFKYIISGVIAVSMIMIVMWGSFKLRGGAQADTYRNAHNNIIGALEQVAQGNFDVLLDQNTIGGNNEFTRAFNEMAQSLGTLESMRQDFISNVSHEIQSPLTSIGGYAVLLQKDDLPAGERQKYAAVIEAESKRLSSLSDNLLKLSSLDNKIPISKRDFRLDKQLKNLALALEPQWVSKNLTVEADLVKLSICGDEDLLSQLWMNLLHNAIKFTPEGGYINIALAEDNESAIVKISDSGVGISTEDQIHIFERFFKADKSRDRALGGNGLGLSLVKKIIELHEGNITFISEPEKGTEFTVTIPKK